MKILLLSLLLLLAAMFYDGTAEQTAFGLAPEDYTVVTETDSHGGFLGDGLYTLVLDCGQNRDRALETVEGWKPLPLSEPLRLMMYGGEKDGTVYDYLGEESLLPEIENGWYFFEDRHSESRDPADDAPLLDRYSFNFSLAVYDADTDILYYFALDT